MVDAKLIKRPVYLSPELWEFLDTRGKRDGRKFGEQIREMVAKIKRDEEGGQR